MPGLDPGWSGRDLHVAIHLTVGKYPAAEKGDPQRSVAHGHCPTIRWPENHRFAHTHFARHPRQALVCAWHLVIRGVASTRNPHPASSILHRFTVC